jgi:hypothetical protein
MENKMKFNIGKALKERGFLWNKKSCQWEFYSRSRMDILVVVFNGRGHTVNIHSCSNKDSLMISDVIETEEKLTACLAITFFYYKIPFFDLPQRRAFFSHFRKTIHGLYYERSGFSLESLLLGYRKNPMPLSRFDFERECENAGFLFDDILGVYVYTDFSSMFCIGDNPKDKNSSFVACLYEDRKTGRQIKYIFSEINSPEQMSTNISLLAASMSEEFDVLINYKKFLSNDEVKYKKNKNNIETRWVDASVGFEKKNKEVYKEKNRAIAMFNKN